MKDSIEFYFVLHVLIYSEEGSMVICNEHKLQNMVRHYKHGNVQEQNLLRPLGVAAVVHVRY